MAGATTSIVLSADCGDAIGNALPAGGSTVANQTSITAHARAFDAVRTLAYEAGNTACAVGVRGAISAVEGTPASVAGITACIALLLAGLGCAALVGVDVGTNLAGPTAGCTARLELAAANTLVTG